ncbi:MAG: orotidine-5'-phosphate decarboxylase [Bacilli bacterium]
MNREVIIACDFSNRKDFVKFIDKFNEPLFLKIGMELFYKEGIEIIEYVKSKNHKVFLDLKLHDIPNTVYKAMLNIAKLDVEFVTVHASGGSEMLKSAAKAVKNTSTKILGVTVLTSIDEEILNNELNVNMSVRKQAVNLAKLCKENDIFGVICSPNEVKDIKNQVNIKCVTPGIRLTGDSLSDQKRVATPNDAYKMGSDYIVVGRSITASEDAVLSYKKCVKLFGGSYE